MNKSYFGLCILHLEVMKLACLMHIGLLFPVSLRPGSALGEKEEKNRQFPPAQSTPWLASFTDIFLFDPLFCLFPSLRSLVPGYFLWFYVSVGVCDRILISDAVYSGTGFSLTY